MRTRSSLTHGLVVLCVLSGFVLAADPEPLPTSDELHKLFDDGKYQQVLAKLPRVLALKGPAAAGYDQVDLNILKADTFIQLKQQQQAVSALADAQKAATPKTDPKVAAKARAMQIAIKHSQAFAYKSKASKGAKSISLQDMTQRPALYTALLDDMEAEVSERVKTAKSSKTLPPIITAIQGLTDMGAVETVATGSDTASQKAADDLANGARQLMADSVKTMSDTQSKIDNDANRLVELPPRDVPVRRGDPNGRTVPERRWRKTGLTSANRDALRDIADTCQKIQDACVDFAAVSKVHAGGFQSVADTAGRLGQDAKNTMAADYFTEITQR
jgi:hypothetical protein